MRPPAAYRVCRGVHCSPFPVSFFFLQLSGVNAHRSNAQELIAQVAPIEVAANVAMCDGGGGATGHPIEFLKLDTRNGPTPVVCKYCGLQFVKKAGFHGH